MIGVGSQPETDTGTSSPDRCAHLNTLLILVNRAQFYESGLTAWKPCLPGRDLAWHRVGELSLIYFVPHPFSGSLFSCCSWFDTVDKKDHLVSFRAKDGLPDLSVTAGVGRE